MDDEPDALDLMRTHRPRPRHGGRHAVAWIAGLVTALALLIAGLAVGAVALFVHDPKLIGDCDLSQAHPRWLGENTVVHAGDGSRLGVVPSYLHRRPVPLARMGRWLPAATVAIEDRRFWTRRGALDYEAIVRAAVADVRARRFEQGGSTLVQQLARDRYLRDDRPELDRKLKEACLAVQISDKLPRRRILELYLNGAFFGAHAYGVYAASRTYFARAPAKLSLVQAATLAGLPQAPTVFNPLKHRHAARHRRNDVLAALRDSGAITPARYARAVRRPLRLHPTHAYSRIHEPPFFETARRDLVRRFGGRRTRRGGLRVRTTLDPRLQRQADAALRNWLRLSTDPAGALVAMDPATGAVRAMAIRTPDGRPLHFNLATQSRRQAGSTFKVFTLTAAMEQGIPLSSVWRGPPSLRIGDPRCETAGVPWTVHNFADEKAGTMSLREATAHSVNTIFAQVALRAGLDHVVDAAQRLGVRSPLVPVCSLTLGPEGVSPLDMTTAFATLAAGGVRHWPQVLERVSAPGGRTLVDGPPRGRRVVSAGVVDRVTSALTGVIRSGTGVAAGLDRPAAGKTGTAEGFKDAWFCGFVPQLATCVWIGNPHAETPMAYVDGFAAVVGGSVPARIWHDFMSPALAGEPVTPL